MTIRSFTLAAAALFALSIAPVANNVASAMPVNKSVAANDAAATIIQTVQYHRRGRGYYNRGRRGGAGVAAGMIGGMILGGMLAGPRAYDYAPGPSYGPGYYGGDAVGYCMQRFKSYDPRSGTYLGYDGYRHPCP
jgi:hypothetical protein